MSQIYSQRLEDVFFQNFLGVKTWNKIKSVRVDFVRNNWAEQDDQDGKRKERFHFQFKYIEYSIVLNYYKLKMFTWFILGKVLDLNRENN